MLTVSRFVFVTVECMVSVSNRSLSKVSDTTVLFATEIAAELKARHFGTA